jgi:hypothetical protein
LQSISTSPTAISSLYLYLAGGYKYSEDIAVGEVLIDCNTRINGDLTVIGTINGDGGGGGGVTSLNSLDGELTITAFGTNITVSDNGSNEIQISSNAEQNQNAFSTITAGPEGQLGTDINASIASDTLQLFAGDNVEFEINAGPGQKSITINSSAASSTTYDLSAEGTLESPVFNPQIQLAGSDLTTDSVTLEGGTGISITGIGDNIIQFQATPITSGMDNFNIQVNGGTEESITDNETINFVESGATTITRSGNTITIDSSDTNTQRSNQDIINVITNDGFTKNSGTVTSIEAGAGLTGGTITSSGTISIDSDANILAANFTINSDKRVKSNIIKLQDGINTIKQLHPYSFIKNNKQQIGILAQELESISPESVIDGTDGYKTIDIHALSTLNLSAIHGLIEKVEYLENKLKMLEDNGNR